MLNYIGIAILVLVLDQISKQLITQWLDFGETVTVAPFFNLVLVHNPGAAFSFLSDASGWQREFFIVIALAASAWIVYLLWKHPDRPLFNASLSLILGGALGNVVDRVRFGAVIDFFDLHLLGYHWPAFNIADSAISCGAALLIWDAVRSSHAAHTW